MQDIFTTQLRFVKFGLKLLAAGAFLIATKSALVCNWIIE